MEKHSIPVLAAPTTRIAETATEPAESNRPYPYGNDKLFGLLDILKLKYVTPSLIKSEAECAAIPKSQMRNGVRCDEFNDGQALPSATNDALLHMAPPMPFVAVNTMLVTRPINVILFPSVCRQHGSFVMSIRSLMIVSEWSNTLPFVV